MVNFHLGFFVLASFVVLCCGSSRHLPILSFDEGYSQLFGADNLMVIKDGKSVHLSLDERTGSGFVSQDLYLHGFFSASLKLPSDYTAGVVVAFYMSNVDMFEKNHDEIDFEFLGNIRGKDWRIQTNIYGNGSTSVGREERYGIWFDPSEDFRQYGILWTDDQIIFYVDNVPMREIKGQHQWVGTFLLSLCLFMQQYGIGQIELQMEEDRVNYKYAPNSQTLCFMVVLLIQLSCQQNVTILQNMIHSLLELHLNKELKWRISGKHKCNTHIVMIMLDTRFLQLNASWILRKPTASANLTQ